MKNVYLIVIILIFSFVNKSFSQDKLIYSQIERAKNGGAEFVKMPELFKLAEREEKALSQFEKNEEVVFLNYSNTLNYPFDSFISIAVPTNNDELVLELIKVPDTFYDYNVLTSDGQKMPANRNIIHYRGIVKGNSSSLVAISFFEEEVIGVISTSDGNFNISLDRESGKHLYYNDNNAPAIEFECSVEESVGKSPNYKPDVLNHVSKSSLETGDECVRFYLETEYDIFQTRGSVVSVELYIASIFNQVATLYQNDFIWVNIGDIFVWTSTDPYTATNTADLLDQFQTNRTSISGDLGQLLTFRNVGGGRAAGYSGLCNSTVSEKLAVSGISNQFANVPTYSFTVMVITHEFGHLFGSYHTHDCVWNGNNTAIDGCGLTVGGCPNPGIPSAGGTIMSYCHQKTVGINFALGFGPQPANVIINSIAGANCLCECVSSSISGSNFLCSTGSYSLTPESEPTTWSVIPTNLFSGSTSGSGTTASLTASSGARGLAVLTFTVATSCGNVEVKKGIWVGKARVDIVGPYDMEYNTVENFFATGGYPYTPEMGFMGITNFNWDVSPSGYDWIGGQGTSGITLSISSPGDYSLTLNVTNPCGVVGSEYPIWVYGPGSMFTFYPNPASDVLTISKRSSLSSHQSDTAPFEISLYDNRGQQLVEPVIGTEEVSLDVSHLKNGFYFIHVLYNGKLVKRQILVER